MTDEIAAVPAATSAGYGEAVSDDEFETWVKRSQEETEAALGDWDTSVQFDMLRNGAGVPYDPDYSIDVEIVPASEESIGSMVETRERVETRWADLQRRILADEELGPEDRAWVATQGRIRAQINEQSPNNCPPDCPQCANLSAIQIRMAEARANPAYVGVVVGTGSISFSPEPRQASMRMLTEPPSLMEQDQMRFAETLAAERRLFVIRNRLASAGFVVLERTQPLTTTAAILGLELPGQAVIDWARREFGVE